MGVKYFVDETFFETWSPEMAYVLGYLYADGSLEDASYLRGRYVRVTSIDRSSILQIRKLLHSKHTVVIRKKEKPSRNQYFLRIGSHKLYDSLLRLGLYPNKSLTIQLPYIAEEFFSHFVRGYFDGDGCVYLEFGKGKTRKKIIKRLSVIFTSGSKDFLEQLSVCLSKRLQEPCHKVYTNRSAYQLRFRTSISIRLFSLFYKDAPLHNYLRWKLKIF